MSEEEAKLGIAAAMQGMEQAQTSAPESVATPADQHAAHRLQVKNAPVKYRGPNGESWSGRGLKPRWVTAYVGNGGTLGDLEVTGVVA